jgi:AcrR family transcriptional regulator
VRAALQLVDDKGLAALTMRALATELEVSTMALYNHVKDKDELVDLMVDLMLGEVDCSVTEGDWMAQLHALACSYHHALSAHEQLARVYSARVRIGPHGLTIIERAMSLLLQAGFSPPEAADAFFALYTYIVGFHQIGRTMPLAGSSSRDSGGFYKALPVEQIPSLRKVIPYLDLGGVHRPGGFEYGLDTLLVGLQARLSGIADRSSTVAEPSRSGTQQQ